MAKQLAEHMHDELALVAVCFFFLHHSSLAMVAGVLLSCIVHFDNGFALQCLSAHTGSVHYNYSMPSGR